MSGKEKMNMQDGYDKNDYRTSAEMTLDEQIKSTKQALGGIKWIQFIFQK